LEWLFGIGTGVLKWSDEATLRTNMNHIRLAYDAHCKMLEQIFGSKKKEGEFAAIATTGAETKDMMRGLQTRMARTARSRGKKKNG
jgi:hypothetical protein